MILLRVCILQRWFSKLKVLGFCHALYHQSVTDPHCICDDGMARSAPIVQHGAAELANYCLHLVGGRDSYSV